MNKLFGKLIIKSKIVLETGMHIGASNDFAPIGAVDMTYIRDPLTKQPIIPGSSIKGKLRYLLVRVFSETGQLPSKENDSKEVKRLFGDSNNSDKEVYLSRLQFYDLKLSTESKEKLDKANLDLPYAEIKFENTINRLTNIAMPRQIERVPAGAEFDFKLVYNIEDIEEIEEDFKNIKLAVDLIEDDYIGGHGTRGYGRIKFDIFYITHKSFSNEEINIKKYEELLNS